MWSSVLRYMWYHSLVLLMDVLPVDAAAGECCSRSLLLLNIWPTVVAASVIAAIDTSQTVPGMLRNPSLLAGMMTCPQTVMLFNEEQRMAKEQR